MVALRLQYLRERYLFFLKFHRVVPAIVQKLCTKKTASRLSTSSGIQR